MGILLGAELITGGVVGTAVSALYGKLIDVQDKSVGPLHRDVKSMAHSLKPLIEEIGELDMKLNLPSQEAENLKKLIERIITDLDKLSSAPDANLLYDMEGSLQRGLEVMKLEGVKDVKEMRVSIRNIESVLKRIEENLVVQGWGAVPQTPSFTVGLDVPLKELKRKLLKDDDDDRVSMLVLTAPGGCGKTTLAKLFCQDEQVKGKFKNNIFFDTVSHKSNSHVVHQLYQWKKIQLSAFQNEDIAFDWLQRFLKEYGQNHLLLVLDDVWPESKSLLQKCCEFKEPTMSNCKILVTSRFKFPRFGSQYYLGSLNDEDAMTLFRQSASLRARSSSDLKDLSTEIVKLCKRLPLAIEVVGKSLREICEEPIEIWQDRIDQWFGGSSILDSEESVLDCLQSSVDVLDKEKDNIKECFIDLGSFPEDRRIPAAALIDMWAELYELVKDRMSITNLYKLTDRSLANLVVTRKEKGQLDDYYSEHFVTQHDIIRELAIHQTNNEPIQQRKRLIIDIRGDNLPNWWTEQKYQPIKARLVSITTDVEFSTNWPNMELPEAEVLVLNFQTENYVIPEFVEKMKKLKVLIVTNYGFVPAELSNFQLLGSLPNLKRIRLQGISIPSISKNVPIQLKSLQKMSLFMCKIGQAFSNCSIQIVDALANLVELNIDYCNDLVALPAKLFDLIRLTKLSITHSHKLSALPEDIKKLVNLEVLRLRSCTDLVMLPGSIKNLTKLNFLDISDCFSIKELPEEIGKLSSLGKLNMRQCSRLEELPVSVLDLGKLREVVCDKDTKYLWDPFNPSARNIDITVAKDNFNLDWLFGSPAMRCF